VDVEALRGQHYNAAVKDIRHVNDGLIVLRVQPDSPKPAFEAGQWTFLGLGLWEARCEGCPPDDSLTPEDRVQLQRSVYSLSGSILADGEDRLLREDEEDWYEFYIVLDRTRSVGRSGAALAARLIALRPGSRLWVADEPQGKNTLQGVRPDDDVVFLATGTGEAPHNRMVAELLRREQRGRVASIVTARQAGDLAYRDVHERLKRTFDGYRWCGIATRDADAPGRRLQAMLESGELEEHASVKLDPRRCHVFLCGSAGMVGRPRTDDAGARSYPQPTGMIELLEKRGFRAEPPDDADIHFERY
jgi:ferredoxin--NADP+ reductase